MCRASKIETPIGSRTKTSNDDESYLSFFKNDWTVPAWFVFSCLPFLPMSLYINRGYTQWFHGLSILFTISRDEWFCKFLAVQGFSITLGWYASLLAEFVLHDRFAHILYINMPKAMTDHIIDPRSGQVEHGLFESPMAALWMKILAHLLDILGHPLLTYYYWNRCWKMGHTFDTITTTSVCVCAYIFSRVWSITHCNHNFGTFDLFYFGYDVYVLPPDSDHLWFPAYISEGLFFLCIIVWKMCPRQKSSGVACKN